MIFSGNTFCRSDLARCLTRLTTVSPLLCDSTTTWHHHHHHRHHCDTKPTIVIIIIMIPIRLKAPIIPIVISEIQWSRSRSGDIERTRSIPRRERCLWHSSGIWCLYGILANEREEDWTPPTALRQQDDSTFDFNSTSHASLDLCLRKTGMEGHLCSRAPPCHSGDCAADKREWGKEKKD